MSGGMVDDQCVQWNYIAAVVFKYVAASGD